MRGVRSMSSRPMALVHRYLAMAFVALVLVEFYLAGRGVFAARGPVEDAASMNPHVGLGRAIQGVALVLLLTAALSRAGRRPIMLAGVLFVLMMLQGLLAGLGSDSPWVAGGLHPLNGLLVLGLGTALVLESGHGRRRGVFRRR